MSAYLDWKVGDKIVCIDNRGQQNNLIEGAVYTISAIGVDQGELFVGLVEKPIPDSAGFDWFVTRFRPVTKRTTDISIFTQLLISPKVPERA